MGKSTISTGPFSIATLNYQRVPEVFFADVFRVFLLRLTREFNQQEWEANKRGQHPEIIRWGSTSCSKTEEPG